MTDSDFFEPNRTQKSFSKFRHLWKPDDPNWLKDRKLRWSVVDKNYVARIEERTKLEKAYFRDFFIYGRESTEDLLWRIMNIGEARFYCTPWTTDNEAISLFESIVDICDDHEVSGIVSSGPYQLCSLFNGLDDTRDLVLVFLEAIYYPQYKAHLSASTPNKYFENIWDPLQLTRSYIGRVLGCIANRVEWKYCFIKDCVPFLLEQMNKIETDGGPAARNLDRLTDILFGLKKAKTKNPSHLEMMENLRAGFTSNDAPQWLREHCKAKIKS